MSADKSAVIQSRTNPESVRAWDALRASPETKRALKAYDREIARTVRAYWKRIYKGGEDAPFQDKSSAQLDQKEA